jgi:hypothetical protein
MISFRTAQHFVKSIRDKVSSPPQVREQPRPRSPEQPGDSLDLSPQAVPARPDPLGTKLYHADLKDMERPTQLDQGILDDFISLRYRLKLSEVGPFNGDAHAANFSRIKFRRILNSKQLETILAMANTSEKARYFLALKPKLKEVVEESEKFFKANPVERTHIMIKDGYWRNPENWHKSKGIKEYTDADTTFRLPGFKEYD